jgi:O-succinylhomoserine sulfhydrylase
MRYEGAAAGFAFASGMAAVYSTMAALNLRSHCFFEQCFGATHSLFINYFPWNIQTSYFDINQPETIEGLITPDTKFYLESPTNPAVDIIDLELLGILPKAQFNFNY